MTGVHEGQTMTELEELTRAVADNTVAGGSLFGRTVARIIELTVEPLRDAGPQVVRAELAAVCAWANRTKPTMATVRNAVILALATADATDGSARAVASAMRGFVARSEKAVEALADGITDVVKPGARVLCHSNSGSLRSVLRRVVGVIPDVSINVTESRPYRESRRLVEGIAESGVPVTLFSDAAMAVAASRSDVALVGADAVFADGTLVNKTGTMPLALACRYHGVPFYGVTELAKVVDGDPAEVRMELRPGSELSAGWELADSGRVDVSNQFFEPTPAELITSYLTEAGLVAPAGMLAAYRSSLTP
ncbi:translation initiation factor eIF-2B [Paractinoplanes lichenicola]|uniref:Uncharacterized protein n=1 Tax=Paractinoplanes lichenicola TaxID=2802976 RepID=A0ABS1VDM0_9ACTN|nr:hypothetical protein [Actinoplanes lichenicola]MBL7252756.1 hypothetical protein [Actinoplanes lichenicola]